MSGDLQSERLVRRLQNRYQDFVEIFSLKSRSPHDSAIDLRATGVQRCALRSSTQIS